jgi:hypothetical protein
LPGLVKTTLRECVPGLTINDSKTIFSSKAHNRHVTGITISNANKLSLGRDKKRLISSLIHKYKIGVLESEKIEPLRGMLSHAKHIEPLFLVRLKKKYGRELIKSIRSGE